MKFAVPGILARDIERRCNLRPVKGLRVVDHAANLRTLEMSVCAIVDVGHLQAVHLLFRDVRDKAQLRSEHVVIGLRNKDANLDSLARVLVAIHRAEGHAVFAVVIERVERARDRITRSAVTQSADFATERRLFGTHRGKLPVRKLFAAVVLERHHRLAEFRRAFQAHAVLAGREPEAHRASRLLVEFRDEFSVCIANEQAAVHILVEFEARACAAQVGHHHIARSREVHVATRVLGAAHRLFGALQRLVECELVGLGQSDLAVTAQVAGAAEPAHQRVREERALQLVAFLARFILRAAGNERVALHVAALVHHERGHRHAALQARDSTRAAGIDNRNLHVGAHRVDALAQFLPGINFVTQTQALLVGMPAVVKEYLVTARSGLALRNPAIKHIELFLEGGHARLLHEYHVARLHAAHLAEHLRKRLRVTFGIAQHRTALPAKVRAHRNHVAVNASVIALLGRIRIRSRSEKKNCNQ